MNDNIIISYSDTIENAGFKSCGKVINLDNVPTENGGKIGIGMECLDRDLWEFAPVSDHIKSLGVHMARLQSGWQKTEKTEGVYDFAWLDDVVDKLLADGIEPFMCLCYGNKIYCNNPQNYPDIQRGGVGHMPFETEREKCGWVNYVTKLTRHFKGRIRYYEIWNEADVSTFLCTDKPWCDCYMELVKMTAPVIRENDPDAFVISCTAALDSGSLLVDMGIADYVDVHSFHNYSLWPELRLGEQCNILTHIKNKAPHLRMWRGEAGCPSYNDPRSKGALSDKTVSEAIQAKFIMRHINCDMTNDLLEKTFYFHAYDFEHFKKIVRYHYGLLRHEEPRRKPSYYCLQLLTHIFDGNVKACNNLKLSFSFAYNKKSDELSYSQQLNMKFFAFESDKGVFFAYYLPYEIKNEVFASKTYLSLPYVESMKNPVILDPFTGNIYPVEKYNAFCAPVTDYPMYIMDASMLEGISEIQSTCIGENEEKEIKQNFEE